MSCGQRRAVLGKAKEWPTCRLVGWQVDGSGDLLMVVITDGWDQKGAVARPTRRQPALRLGT